MINNYGDELTLELGSIFFISLMSCISFLIFVKEDGVTITSASSISLNSSISSLASLIGSFGNSSTSKPSALSSPRQRGQATILGCEIGECSLTCRWIEAQGKYSYNSTRGCRVWLLLASREFRNIYNNLHLRHQAIFCRVFVLPRLKRNLSWATLGLFGGCVGNCWSLLFCWRLFFARWDATKHTQGRQGRQCVSVTSLSRKVSKAYPGFRTLVTLSRALFSITL